MTVEANVTETVRDLLLGGGGIRTSALAGLSDLSPAEVEEITPIWREAPVERRRQLVNELRDLAEDNIEYNYKRLFLLALTDPDPPVRATAVEGLWAEEGPVVLDRLQDLLRSDRHPEVRASAAAALGRFAYLAEVGRLDPSRVEQLQELLRRVLRDAPDDSELQMRVLESLAYFAGEPVVPEYIGRLYREGDEEGQASALVAMGRSMDHRWDRAIIQELDSDSPRLRFQAARAAGEMELEESVPELTRLIEEPDAELRDSAIWALGQIGSPRATDVLKRLANDDDDATREAAEVALGEAMYSGEYE